MFQFAKYFIRQPARAFVGLDESSANTSHGLRGARDFLVGLARNTVSDLRFTVSNIGRPGFFMVFMVPKN